MSQVSVSINGHNYLISCDDGQEKHLTQLAQYVDKRIEELVASVGQVGDARLLVMASLLIADELSEAYADLEKLRSEVRRTPTRDELAGMVETAASRIETIAGRLEGN